jgi:phage shock protein C
MTVRGHHLGMSNPLEGKHLHRVRQGRVIAGVCTGMGAYFGVDPNLVRVAFALLTCFGGIGIGFYALAWLIVPEEGEPSSIAENLINKKRS